MSENWKPKTDIKYVEFEFHGQKFHADIALQDTYYRDDSYHILASGVIAANEEVNYQQYQARTVRLNPFDVPNWEADLIPYCIGALARRDE